MQKASDVVLEGRKRIKANVWNDRNNHDGHRLLLLFRNADGRRLYALARPQSIRTRSQVPPAPTQKPLPRGKHRPPPRNYLPGPRAVRTVAIHRTDCVTLLLW